MTRWYLDHNACTPADPRVLHRLHEVEESCPANPGSTHQSGRAARTALEEARGEVAGGLRVPENTVFFVSGGTEANNIAVFGSGEPGLPVLLSAAEHPSVLEAAEQRGCVLLEVDDRAHTRFDKPAQRVGFVCTVHGQNEVGTLQDVGAAHRLASTLGVPLHVDASQTLGRVALDEVLELADSVALSTHKAGGVRGCGVLMARNQLRPLLHGGGQESGLRPGTPSPALATATARAVTLAVTECEARSEAMARNRSAFLDALRDVPSTLLTPADSLPNTALILFEGLDGRTLLPALDLEGIEASQGSACSAGSPQPPRVLSAMGLSRDQARSCVRFSFSSRSEPDEMTAAASVVARVIRRLR